LGWWRTVAGRVSERDVRRQLLYNGARRKIAGRLYLAHHLRLRIPEICDKYIKMTLATLAAFWLLAKALFLAFNVDPLVVLRCLG
jgi:hypothetical protein